MLSCALLTILSRFIIRIHFLKRGNDSRFSVQAVLSYQNAEPTADEEKNHGEYGHAEEILGLIMHLLRVLRAHSFRLERLRTLFKRLLLYRLYRLFCRADHSIHVEALHEEEASSDNVDHQDDLQRATIAHQDGSLVLYVLEELIKRRLFFPFLDKIMVHLHKGLI